MTNTDLLSPWVRRFLLEYLVGERNLARNTQKSYRDSLLQFLPFVARSARRRIERLRVDDVSPVRTKAFLLDLERTRRCGIATRNQRLAAIHSLARFIGLHSPENLEWAGQILAIRSKKAPRPLIGYLEKEKATWKNESQVAQMEAAGIEPASRDISMQASTCVVD